MLTYEIKRIKPTVVSPPGTPPTSGGRSLVQVVKDAALGRRAPQQQQIPLNQFPGTPGSPGPVMSGSSFGSGANWDKIEYTKWIENEIRPKFPIGTLVTLNSLVYCPGALPMMIYRVELLQEVKFMADWDQLAEQFKCVMVKPWDLQYGLLQSFPPNRLRRLNTEEVDLARLHDKTPPGLVSAEGQPLTSANESYAG